MESSQAAVAEMVSGLVSSPQGLGAGQAARGALPKALAQAEIRAWALG